MSLLSYQLTSTSATYVGCIIKYLPPYSPDLTPIEESFSCHMYSISNLITGFVVLCLDDNPVIMLMEATSCITAEKAYGWFKHAGYIFE
ncbi:hypothetical protein EDC04DRAFT_2595402 [Pisolithus marmoratus]|nr:hypothetical protein EDC04DRAFT_2595402 [Pisolithus marmoratus]